jgi:membrane dipeptidase
MPLRRRDFLKNAAVAGVGSSALAAAGVANPLAAGAPGPSAAGEAIADPMSMAGPRQVASHGKSVHTVLETDPPFIYVDPCMQMWPDGDFHLAHRHGVTAYAVTAWDPHADAAAATDGIMFWHGLALQYPNLVVAKTVEDIRRAKGEGKAGLLLAAQCGDWVGYELGRVQAFRDMGLRMMLLAYNASNQLCDGCLDRTDGGLTLLGQRVVDECNRVGILLDCTHTGKRATLEIMERSVHPCVFSHSNPSALAPNPRNIDDEQIRACVSRGGVIALVAWGPLCMRPDTTHRPTLEEFFQFIHHVTDLAGSPDHVAISTDMSIGTYPDHHPNPFAPPRYPDIAAQYNQHVTADFRSPMRQVEGFEDYAQIVEVADRLLTHGYSEGDVRKILGENFLRVARQAWGA